MGEVDAMLTWLREHVGSTLFGAIVGWMLRSMIDPPSSPLTAMRNIAIAVALAVAFARPMAAFFGSMLGMPAESLVEACAAILAVSGEHAVYGIQRMVKKAMRDRS